MESLATHRFEFGSRRSSRMFDGVLSWEEIERWTTNGQWWHVFDKLGREALNLGEFIAGNIDNGQVQQR